MAANREEIRAKLAEIVYEIAGFEDKDVQLGTSFAGDLGLDSLSLVEVVITAEDRFGVRVSDDYVRNLHTVGDAVDYILRAEPAASTGKS